MVTLYGISIGGNGSKKAAFVSVAIPVAWLYRMFTRNPADKCPVTALTKKGPCCHEPFGIVDSGRN
jgi:hypothetical protein